MSLDADISTAIETKLTALTLTTVIVQNTKQPKPTQAPWIYVNTNGPGARAHADLSSFYRKEFPFSVEMRGSDNTNVEALEDAVESALMTLSATIASGWIEIETGLKQEQPTKKNQRFIVGKKVLYQDIS